MSDGSRASRESCVEYDISMGEMRYISQHSNNMIAQITKHARNAVVCIFIFHTQRNIAGMITVAISPAEE